MSFIWRVKKRWSKHSAFDFSAILAWINCVSDFQALALFPAQDRKHVCNFHHYILGA
jgi:hypothetical protein